MPHSSRVAFLAQCRSNSRVFSACTAVSSVLGTCENIPVNQSISNITTSCPNTTPAVNFQDISQFTRLAGNALRCGRQLWIIG